MSCKSLFVSVMVRGGLLLSLSSPLFAEAFDYAVTLEMDSNSVKPSRRGTYLLFMEQQVKPAIDKLAQEGYSMCDGDTVAEAYEAAARKVQGKVRAFGGLKTVQSIADRLVTRLKGKKVTHLTLPQEIRAVAPRADIYDLANFFGLACGGGVKITYAPGNYSLNVHYDVTEQRSGRSFGVGPSRGANDASDKEYLTDLESYTRGQTENLPAFYRALFQSLLSTDGRSYSSVSDEGQTVLTDFLAVYTAEQARNLMDGKITQHWDAALLEVTLIAGFHAGQESMKIYYRHPGTGKTTFTNKTLKQKPCETPTQNKEADLTDYWQFSRNITDPRNCKRSGINITRGEFRHLGEDLTTYLAAEHAEALTALSKSMGLSRTPKNIFESLSRYLISPNAPRELSTSKAREITENWVEVLTLLTQNADAITAGIEQ